MIRLNRILLIVLMILPVAGAFSQNISNKGRDFWVGYGHHQFMEQGNNTQDMAIYLSTEEQPAQVVVTIDSSGLIPALWWRRTYNIPAFTVISITANGAATFAPASAGAIGPIPKGPTDAGPAGTDVNFDARLYTDPPPAGTGGAGLFRRKGIHITSNVPIVAYAHIYGSASSGATMLLPIDAWGYSYVSVNSRQDYASNCYNWMYIIAQKDNTVVEITPSVKTRSQNTTGLAPGVTSTITMMKGQIYQIIGANSGADANGNFGSSATGLELTGTKVRSVAGPSGQCNPIAVFAGSSRTSNPTSCGATSGGDNDNQQLFPVHAWGKRYATAPFSGSSNAASFATASFKIVVKDPTTQVRKNGILLTGMNPAGYYFYESSTADYIESDKPIQVAQFMTGGGCLGAGSDGDPEMIVLSPIEQATKRVAFYRNDEENIDANFLTLVIPTAGITSLRIDNSALFNHVFAHPNLPGYSVVIKEWTPAAKAQGIAFSDSAFNAITYGIGSVESYGYNAGTFINNLNAIGSVHNQLDPSVSEHPFTCTNTPVELSVLMAYQPTRLEWLLNPLAAVMTPSANVIQTAPVSSGTVIIDGISYYKYTLPGTYMFSVADTFAVSILATGPTVDNCNNTEEIRIEYIVKEKPIPDFTFTHTGCTLDTVYFAGQNLAGGGFTLGQWNWQFPASVTATGQNVKKVLPPGTHNVTLTGISSEGCVGDITKPLTVHPKPTADFTITPPAVCFGQQITLSGTSAYAGTSPTINTWYWDLGNSTLLNNTNGNDVTVNYATPNTYTVRHVVKVTDLCISDTITKTVVISPEALISFTYPTGCLPASGLANFTASLTDLGGIPITSYSWDFGDPTTGAANTSTAQNPSHTYSGALPQYPVTLTFTTNTGCTGDTLVNLTVGVQPVLSFPAAAPICVTSSAITLTAGATNGVPGNGLFSGTGITSATAGTFDPAIAGPGPHLITYTYTTATCVETITQTVTVNASPVVSAGTYAPVCVDAAPVTLGGSPAGGTFSGTGVTGNTFNPSVAGPGPHQITYDYTDANGCSNSATTTITVNALPVVSAGTYSPVCIDGTAVTLSGSPAGGTFSGPGVAGNTFNPAVAGANTHTITYVYTAANGCTASGTASITVNALPVVNAGTYPAVCVNAAPVTLAGTPAGGAFSGPGVTGNTFNPSVAGANTHTITYAYTDGNGCSNFDDATITVNARPVVNAGTYPAVCVNAVTPVTLTGTPAGGTFSGPGVTGNSFNAGVAGLGTHTITYTYTDANGCGNSDDATISVTTLPVVDAGTYAAVCADAAPVTLNGNPAGGVFSGPGVTGNTFNPATAGAGTHTISYVYTDAGGCSNSDDATITVNAVPVLNAGTYPALCANAATITLMGTPAGGTFSGAGVTNNTFNPATAGPGSHIITYGGVTGCNNSSTTTTITVNPVPRMIPGAWHSVFCQNEPTGQINELNDPGHTLMWYDNPGLTNGSPIAPTPSTAVVGSYIIYVTQVNSFGCEGPPKLLHVDVTPLVGPNTISADQTICSGTAPATLTGPQPSGGDGAFDYRWEYSTNGGATWTALNPDPNPGYNPGVLTTTTQFRRRARSGACANYSNIVTITVLTPITNFNISADQTICEGQTPALLNGQTPAGTGTMSFEWESSVDGTVWTTIGSATTEDYQPPVLITTMWYRRKVTNGACEVTSAPVKITVNPAPQGTITGPAVICSYDAASVSFTATSGTAPFLVQLSVAGPSGTNTVTQSLTGNGTINVLPAGSAAGNYTITLTSITDNTGCPRTTGMCSVNITVNAQPAVTINPVTAICEGNSATLTATGATTYVWSPGSELSSTTGSSVTANPAVNTPYRVIGTTNGCNDTAFVTVNVDPRPTATFDADLSICENETTTLTSTASITAGTITTWNWDLGNGSTPNYNNGNPFTVGYTGYDDHVVTLTTVSDKGCESDPVSKTVAVHPLPVVDFDLPNGICMPGGIAAFTNRTTVADNSALTYNWTFGDAGPGSTATNPTHNYAVANTYSVTLTATSAFNCSAQDAQVLSNFYDKPIALFEAEPAEICQGSDVEFKDLSSAPNSTVEKWDWNFDDNTRSTVAEPTKRFSNARVYDVRLTVTNAVGCVSDPYPLPVTVHLQPVIDAGQSFVVAQGTTIRFTATANSPRLTFNWTPAFGLSKPDTLNPSLVAMRDEIYTLTATGDFDCTASDFITVKILKPVDVPNVFSPNGDNIHDKWVIPNLADYPNCIVEIFNRYGQQVFISTGYNRPWDGTMNGKDLPVGTYYYVIQLKNGFKPINGSVTILR